ncbi:MAG: toprim domain-containing protein [Acholeplasmatales bacterium]|nr:toprim domain-containing protein [Methanobrevibacter sp.]MBP5445448.1 toprim domain-containing protein [Acholeplasmatales bacterium]
MNKSGIRHFILCLDGDEAGFKGSGRFINNIYDDILVDYIKLPEGKDINDLTLEEFKKLEDKYL